MTYATVNLPLPSPFVACCVILDQTTSAGISKYYLYQTDDSLPKTTPKFKKLFPLKMISKTTFTLIYMLNCVWIDARFCPYQSDSN